MKKILNITALVLCVAVVIGIGISSLADESVYRASPNKLEITEVGGYRVNGFVQIQPSYNEGGRHAQYRYLTLSATLTSAKAKAETLVGTHEGDSRLLDDSCTLYYGPEKPYQPEPEYTTDTDTIWQPHTGDPTRPWPHPFSFSPIENPKNPN